MLSFFKSKPTLASLIPNNYVDIHSHVLPGIDDGAKNLKDSQFLLLSAAPLNEPINAKGFFVMNTYSEILQAYEDLKAGKFIQTVHTE